MLNFFWKLLVGLQIKLLPSWPYLPASRSLPVLTHMVLEKLFIKMLVDSSGVDFCGVLHQILQNYSTCWSRKSSLNCFWILPGRSRTWGSYFPGCLLMSERPHLLDEELCWALSDSSGKILKNMGLLRSCLPVLLSVPALHNTPVLQCYRTCWMRNFLRKALLNSSGKI